MIIVNLIFGILFLSGAWAAISSGIKIKSPGLMTLGIIFLIFSIFMIFQSIYILLYNINPVPLITPI